MAEAVAEGVQQAGQTAKLFRITGEQIQTGRWKDEAVMAALANADAIIFGTPTYMGGVAAQFKAFIDTASEAWFGQAWKDKIAAGFTHSSSPSGDKQGTLLYLAINAAQHGMVWVGVTDMPSQYLGKTDGVNRLGSFLGVMGHSELDMSGAPATLEPGDRLTAVNLGHRVADATQRWNAGMDA
jgi:NAD(P)H dehydrogenase (quinone)